MNTVPLNLFQEECALILPFTTPTAATPIVISCLLCAPLTLSLIHICALIFDEQADRYDIRFDLADYYGGLHGGETFDVMVGGRWKPCLLYTSRCV